MSDEDNTWKNYSWRTKIVDFCEKNGNVVRY